MSTLLPVAQPRPDFIDDLLRDQQSMSAVQRFNLMHDTSGHTTGRPPAQQRYYRDLMPASPPAPGQQFAFEVDLDQCSGCKACVVACHTMNGLEDEEAWRRVGTVSSVEELGRVQHVTTACHHCETPGCLSGCPVKAYDKDPVTGIVRHLDDQCIGCKYCTMMCPYEVPRYSKRLGIVRKCDMCHQRLSAGEAPACVQACPNGAIAIRIVDQVYQDSLQETRSRLAPGSPPSQLTRPTTKYKTAYAESFAKAVPQDVAIDPVAENHWPLAVMLVATQTSIGILLVERLTAMLMSANDQVWPVEVTRIAALFAFAIGGIGLNLAPLHLGQPLRAWRVFLGLRTSWLSREAIILGKYMGLLALATALLWMPAVADHLPAALVQSVPARATSILLTAAIVVGVAGLYSSAMIYIATRRHLWRSTRTFGRFFTSAAIGGLAWTIPVTILFGDRLNLVMPATAVLSVLMVTKLLWEYRIQIRLSAPADRYDIRSGKLVSGPLRRVAFARFAFGFSGVFLAAAVAVAASASWLVAATIAAASVAVLLTAGELCERLLYFSSVVYDRMPGTLR